MQLLFIDFETYYDTDFNLTSAKSTGEYIGKTQLQLMSYAINRQPVRQAVGEREIREILSRVEWDRTALVSHNGLFDARIVLERLGHKALFYFDTLAMMRSLRWDVIFGGASLSHLSKVLQGNGLSIEDKGDEVAEAKGNYLFKFKNGQWYMHPTEITAEYLAGINITPSGRKRTGKAVKDPRKIVMDAIDLYRRFSKYCDNDVEICRAGFYQMVKLLPKEELKYQDMIIRCALEPKLVFDLPLLKDAVESGKKKVRDAVKPIADKWYNGDMSAGKDALLSTGKLAITMKAMGGMTQDEVDDHISRYGVDPEPAFIIPTKVSEKKSARAGKPVYDYALAKKDPGMVELMNNPYPDLQELMASRRTVVYYNNYELPRLERFINEMEYKGVVGMPLKVSGAFTHRLGGCLVADTMVLCMTSDGEITEKCIVDVLLSDRVWDGVDFVEHDGVQFSGYQQVISYDGITGTPDHKVFISDTETISLAEAKATGAVIMSSRTRLDVDDDGRSTTTTPTCLTLEQDGVELVPVYDIRNAGPRRRFSANGKLVHNSIFNIQNMSSGRNEGQEATLRKSILAPDGYAVVACDSSQIECVSGDGFVLTDDKGLVKLRDLSIESKIWDGVEYVSHDGILNKGVKRVIEYNGVIGTPEHVVYLRYGGYTTLDEAKAKEMEILVGARGGEPLREMDIVKHPYTTNSEDVLSDVHHLPHIEDLGQEDRTRWGNKYLGAIEVFDIINAGPRNRFCYNDLIISNCRIEGYIANEHKLIEQISAGKDPYCVMASMMYHEDADHINKMRKAGDEKYVRMRSVSKSAMLGAGYGIGAVAFKQYAALMGVDLSEQEAAETVRIYRESNPGVTNLWEQCGEVLRRLVAGESGWFGGPNNDLFYFDGSRFIGGKRVPGIRGPDGLWLNYTDLQMRERTYPDGSKKWNYCYYGIKEGRPMWVWVYPAKLTENICQYLAFAVMKWQAVNINKRYPIAFNVHDEWVAVVPENEADQAVEFMINEMRKVPEWLKGCPLNAEGTYAKSYGDC